MSLDSSQFNSGIEQASSKVGSLKGKMSEIGQGLKDVGTKMTAAGVAMVASVGGIVAKGAEWSASVESTQFLYNNLDKTVQKSISTNAKSAKSLGMTEQQYKKNATTIATYYKNMGLAGEESAKLSQKTMTLSADLAAVADVPVDEALRDVKSALMGNYEAVDKYGVSLSANALENSEYVKSLGKKWNQLSENEKMMAAYNEITRQSSSAQGLAKQEASSFGMQMKLLKESIEETVGQLGSALLPILEPIVKKFQEVTEKVSEWVKENPKLAQAILMVVGGLGLFLAVVGPLVAAVGLITMGIAGLSAVSWPVVGAVAAITAVIVGLVAAGIYLYTHWEEVKAKAIEIWNAIKEGVSNAVSALGDFISATWDGIKAFLSTCWELIKSAANTVWNGIKTVISTAINIIKTIITTVFNAIKLYITTVFNAIKLVATTVWNAIKTVITTVVNGIKTIITTVFNAVKNTITTVFNTIKSLTTSVWNGIKTVINSACNTVKSTVSNVFNGLKNTVKNALDSVYNTAKGIWNKVTGIFTKPISAVVNFVKGGKAGKAAKASYSMLNPKSIPQAQSYAAVSKNYSASEKMASYSRSNSAGINNSSSSPISLSANLNSFVQLDGKTLAKATAPYMSNELDKLTKRKNRLGGAFA
jgi:phage-related protein